MADAGGINPEFERKLNALVAASGGRLKVRNAYRSTATQAKLWANALKKYGSAKAARKWVAPPGNSNHQRGIAADLSGDLKWAHANAARFGLYFPMGHEPWHVEVQGSRSGKQQQTTPPDKHEGHTHGPGNPDAMDELEGKDASWRTIEGQLANLMTAISSPTERAF